MKLAPRVRHRHPSIVAREEGMARYAVELRGVPGGPEAWDEAKRWKEDVWHFGEEMQERLRTPSSGPVALGRWGGSERQVPRLAYLHVEAVVRMALEQQVLKDQAEVRRQHMLDQFVGPKSPARKTLARRARALRRIADLRLMVVEEQTRLQDAEVLQPMLRMVDELRDWFSMVYADRVPALSAEAQASLRRAPHHPRDPYSLTEGLRRVFERFNPDHRTGIPASLIALAAIRVAETLTPEHRVAIRMAGSTRLNEAVATLTHRITHCRLRAAP